MMKLYILAMIIVLCISMLYVYVRFYQASTIRFDNLKKMHDVHRIAVIGCAGSGKTYVSLQLAHKLRIPLYHLDVYHWKKDWQRVQEEVFTQIHHDLCYQDRWIIEGIYLRHAQERFERADAIIFLDMPRTVCVYNVIKRSLLNSGKVIQGNPEGCQQNILNWKFIEFLSWIWNFNRRHRDNIIDQLNKLSDTKLVYVIRSMQEMNKFINEI